MIDWRGKRQNILLGLRHIWGKHTAHNLAQIVAEVIKKYEITHKLGVFMGDNASSNDSKFIHAIREYLRIDLHNSCRVRCAGHIINLIVKAIVFGKGVNKFERQAIHASTQDLFKLWREHGPVGKLHNFVTGILRSHKKKQLFDGLQHELHAPDDDIYHFWALSLVKDGGVRWNATYLMLLRCLELRDAIDLFYTRYRKEDDEAIDLNDDKLTTDDWKEVERLCELLEPFQRMTLQTEGNSERAGFEGQYGSLHETITALNYLDIKLTAAADASKDRSEDSFYKNAILLGQQKLNKYWDKIILEDSPSYYAVATILHPEKRLRWLQYHWRMYKEWWKKAENSVKAIFKEYLEAEEVAEEEENKEEYGSPSHRKVAGGDIQSFDDFLASQDIDESFFVGEKSSRKRYRHQNELESYLNDKACPNGSIKDPLQWWQTNGKVQYPLLYKMAIDFFSIPATSCECERVFSQSKKLITDERNRLRPDTIEACELQKNWLLKGVIASPIHDLIATISRFDVNKRKAIAGITQAHLAGCLQ